MVVLIASTVISCSQAMNLITRLQKVAGLNQSQRTEIMREISKAIPSCPILIQDDVKPK